jgi:hypothetical protein
MTSGRTIGAARRILDFRLTRYPRQAILESVFNAGYADSAGIMSGRFAAVDFWRGVVRGHGFRG